MTIYHVQVGDRIFRVDISGNQLLIDGIIEQAKLIRLNSNGLFMLRRGWRNLELHLRPQNGQKYEVTAEGRRVIAQVEKGEGKPTRLADPSALNSLSAPMPGLVVGIHTQEGERVEKGQVLVTLESMKMQMELRAPVSGRVTRVGAQSRVQIDKGALLVEIKPE